MPRVVAQILTLSLFPRAWSTVLLLAGITGSLEVTAERSLDMLVGPCPSSPLLRVTQGLRDFAFTLPKQSQSSVPQCHWSCRSLSESLALVDGQ